ncbi:LOW QUALITY PROTEIN: hypothetical protein CRUP_015590 [Coryphaenoides rupestris]|nr:LOW QUALITY PROTEIN: hypothetical protein CRUP_015590 [Coryphaenoides rupestris]
MKPLSPGGIMAEWFLASAEPWPGSMAMASIMTFSVMLGGRGEYIAFLRLIMATLLRLLKRWALDSVWGSPTERTGSLARRTVLPGAWVDNAGAVLRVGAVPPRASMQERRQRLGLVVGQEASSPYRVAGRLHVGWHPLPPAPPSWDTSLERRLDRFSSLFRAWADMPMAPKAFPASPPPPPPPPATPSSRAVRSSRLPAAFSSAPWPPGVSAEPGARGPVSPRCFLVMWASGPWTVFTCFRRELGPSLGYSGSMSYQSRGQGSMYGGGVRGGTPMGVHNPGPCHAPRLPPHNPRLLAQPKHGHQLKTEPGVSSVTGLLFLLIGWVVFLPQQLKTEPGVSSVMDGINVKSLEERSEGDLASPSSTGTQDPLMGLLDGRDDLDKDDGKPEPEAIYETNCHWESCSKEFDTQDQLHINNEHIHGEKKEFVCHWQECSREQRPFKAQYMLVVHMRRHTGEKPHKCTHINNEHIHGEKKEFVCHWQECSREQRPFKAQYMLVVHMRRHTGEKPHKCTRELTKATRELGDVRITVCRSTLASDSGEMDSARFLLSFRMERGVENREPASRAAAMLTPGGARFASPSAVPIWSEPGGPWEKPWLEAIMFWLQ